MAKVITFSRTFPSYHPNKGKPTYFVEKFWESLIQTGNISISKCAELSRQTGLGNFDVNRLRKISFDPKNHTIRAGHRFKEGEYFSPRVWSGKPYNSKQIIIAPDIEIKSIYGFEIKESVIRIRGSERSICGLYDVPADEVPTIANNDGLSFLDFMHWFNFPKDFNGQIICWNQTIEY